MSCVLVTPRFSALPLRSADSHLRRNFVSVQNVLPLMNRGDLLGRISMKVTRCLASNAERISDNNRRMAIKATAGSASSEADVMGSASSEADVMTEKSEIYSDTMTEAMGSALLYKHEDGMNYNFVGPDLIIGSCLQTPEDVDKLREIGVKTIFCLQQNPDLKYFGVDIEAIREYAKNFDDLEHVRAEIRDFDGHDLRLRLPYVVSKLDEAIKRNGGVTYIHCTAGLGRAPSVVLAYMFWILNYNLDEALNLLLTNRQSCPKVDALKSATADILSGMKKIPVNLSWKSKDCSTVEIAGLDIGWGERTPLEFVEDQGIWKLERELFEGRYEYKYIVDGQWIHNEHELVAPPTNDGHINNYIEVFLDDGSDSDILSIRKRLFESDAALSTEEREKIKEFLASLSEKIKVA